jgi:uncharacterized repeat protein (TIGR03803 family)
MVLPGMAAGTRTVHYRLTEAMTNAPLVSPTLGWKRLNLAIGLPLRNEPALDKFLADLNNPASPDFRQYMTPSQFTEKFGPTEQDYENVVHFAQTHGLTVTGRHANRMVLDVSGMTVNIEQAFHIKLSVRQHPTEARTFFGPDTEPSVDPGVPVMSISGLDNYQLPHPMSLKKNTGSAKMNGVSQAGSGPGGTYLGQDFRAAYLPGVTLTGTGQTVGLVEFDSGFYPQDILNYESQAGLPNVPVQAVLLDGYSGAAGGGNGEVSLDIEMAISIAPGLSHVLVYEGSATDDVLNRMATDNLARQIGASWTYPIDAVSEQIFKEFAAQGQSFFNASGDTDAYVGVVPPPSDDPNIICVGGTTLTTTGPGGAWVSETVWNWNNGNGSSGGISTVNGIPSWQQGLNMTTNQGSTTQRNFPDVAMVADNIWVIYGNGQAGDFGGTSCATPLWAGFTALVNQLALTNGEPAVGFINPAIYAMGKGSNSLGYTSLFNDITTGNNESSRSPYKFSAVPGYDLCTGWGTPVGGNLLTALALPEPLRIAPLSSEIISGPVGGPFGPAEVSYLLTNNSLSTLNWSLVNTSSWATVYPTNGALVSGGPAVVVNASVNVGAESLKAGSYTATLLFTNVTDDFGQKRQVTLDVVTPPVITAQPTNQAVLIGMTASFNVDIATNALMEYQWQENGTNLTEGGKIAGSTTSTLMVSNVTAAEVGSYSVILSNAAGSAVSSNAWLTIVPSSPVIVLQPTNEAVLPGAPAAFTVGAVGNTPYFYQWQFNGTNLIDGVNVSGSSSNVLALSNVSPAMTGFYSVIVSNELGLTASTRAGLSLTPVTAPGVALSTVLSFGSNDAPQNPYSPLVQGTNGNLYGTTVAGGSDGDGTVFMAGTNGVLNTLHSFFGFDGAFPYAGLLSASNGWFYGATASTDLGGSTIFRLTPAGKLTTAVSFGTLNGNYPVAGLVSDDAGNFYGTAVQGGIYGYGTVFKVTTNNVLTSLVSFNSVDGSYPSCVLVRGTDGWFYGTTENGGTNGMGTLFKVSPSGVFASFYSFTGGNDGGNPTPGLTLGVDGNFYGNTDVGGTGAGTVFQLTPAGVLTTLHTFTNGVDGANPWGGLMQAADGNLYGTTQAGGENGFGTVFRISPDGTMAPLVQFDSYNGAAPAAALIQASDGNLYGTTVQGGSSGNGVIYQLHIGGPLQITGQPMDQSTDVGGTVRFTVATFGASPVYYQWQRDGINLTNGGNVSGANTSVLLLTNVTTDDAAVYSVVVSNAVNSVTSDYAILDVSYSPPNIVQQPASVTCLAGLAARFTVSATGNAPLTFQWRENGTNLTDGGNLSGSTSAVLNLTAVTAANAGAYSVLVSNSLYVVSSRPAKLTVIPETAPGAAVNLLHQFNGGTDGAFSYAGVIQGQDGNLYGTTISGNLSPGTIFCSTLAGDFSTIQSFANSGFSFSGANPVGRLLQDSNGFVWGTTLNGGLNQDGTLFDVSALNGFLISAYPFTGGPDGANPYAGLIQGTDGNYYGTTLYGGIGVGAVFKMTPQHVVTGLYEFLGEDDGAYPYAGLIQGKDGNLYGTTVAGGDFNGGTVFCLNTNGTLTTLVSFPLEDGDYPEAGLVQGTDGKLYGATFEGGVSGDGTLFSLTTNGIYTTLYSFDGSNGANPAGALVQGSDGNLYGTTLAGGAGGQGSVFKMTTNGILTTLLWFDGLNGASPLGSLLQASNGCFYGTTAFGGAGFNASSGGGFGTLFQLTVPIFISSPIVEAAAIGGLPYSATLSGAAVAPPGDLLSFSKVSGPPWLVVASNGALSGTPGESDLGTNKFIVSLTDSNGVSASATMTILVGQDPAPSFIANPFREPFADVDEAYAVSVATNAYDLELTNGDVLTFAKVSGPAWLNVAADGILSGTPQGTDGGTNTLVVSVSNLGGLTDTATLTIYVYSPPYFAPLSFTKPAATVGLSYGGTLATNVVDLDASAGDVLTFYKVSGPLWLDVAPNGALSGIPSSTDVGISYSLMLVVNSGGLAGVGTLNLAVNMDQAPTFNSNPFTAPHANVGQTYVATIATDASDPNIGDSIKFAKVDGPDWLTVNPFGLLSGTPAGTDAGTNIFAVSVTDLSGLSSQATLSIDVAVPIYVGIAQSNGRVLLNWTGGYPPYQVLSGTGSSNIIWSNLGGVLNTNALLLAPTNPANWFRVQGQ